ncbi:MAG: Dabb family protein [Streptosporangiales bacterium]
MAVQHVVLFKFPEQLSPADEDAMRRAVGSFGEHIGEATRLRFGADTGGGRTQGYTYLLLSEFPDESALQRYRDHPVHRDFLDWLAEQDATLLGFDYSLDEQTVLIPE